MHFSKCELFSSHQILSMPDTRENSYPVNDSLRATSWVNTDGTNLLCILLLSEYELQVWSEVLHILSSEAIENQWINYNDS